MTSAARPASKPAGEQAAFRLLFETGTTPVAILDEHRRLVEINVPAQRLLLPCGRDAAGEAASDAVAEPERERSEADWHQLLREGRISGTRTLVRTDYSEVQIAFAAVIESVAGRRRAVYTLTPATADGAEMFAPALCTAALTNREAEIVQLIAGGLDTSDIADVLHVSPNTVRSHVRNAMAKLGARTRAQLVAQVLGGGEGAARASD